MTAAPDFSHCVLASGNPGKLREIDKILGGLGISIVAQAGLGIEGAEETGETFVENALLKARHAARLSGLPAIADDSGLCVAALDGRPGVLSARYAGKNASDQENVNKLLEELRDVPQERRQACFHCAIAVVAPDDSIEPLIAQAKWCGRILQAPAGSAGFGYDPVFFDERIGKGAAQMTADEKNAVSHRGRALRQLASLLRSETAA